MYPSRFNDLSVVQLLQNVEDYQCLLRAKESRFFFFCHFTLGILLEWYNNRLFSKWPTHFPDVICVLDERCIYESDPFFLPDCSFNERRCYILLIHCGKKHKRPGKKLVFTCILFSLYLFEKMIFSSSRGSLQHPHEKLPLMALNVLDTKPDVNFQCGRFLIQETELTFSNMDDSSFLFFYQRQFPYSY